MNCNSSPVLVAMRVVAVAAIALVASQTATAVSLVINNASFEDPSQAPGGYVGTITGWTSSGITSASGVWDPSGSYAGTMGPVPDGKQVGYINYDTISQPLAYTLQPNTLYTLSIDVGGRNDSPNPGVAYSVSLFAGANLLTSVVPVSPPIGAWTTLTATYVTAGSALPDSLRIEVAHVGVGDQFDFDNVRLDAMPVPEPRHFALIAGCAVIGFAGYRRLRK